MEDAASDAPTVHDGWLVWEVPGKPVSVRLSEDVIGRLGMAVWEGFKALPRRGLETGGLLIGTKSEAGNQVVVTVNDFEPVESEHAAGPSYLLSDADRRMLEARIDAREAAAKKTSLVGFYRSHTRPDFAITMEDASLFSTYFPKASDVFLLIKANDGGPPTAGFIIWEGGEVISVSPYVQFPFRTVVMPAAHETPVSALPASQASPLAAETLQPSAPQRTTSFQVGHVGGEGFRRRWSSPGTSGGRPVMWRIGLATAVAVALAVGLVITIHRPGIQRRISGSMPAAKPGLSLAVNVTNTGTCLRLSWDQHVWLQAGHAVLWIKDGQEEQRFELDSKQLSEGSVAYWPRNSDVNFRLELLSPGGNITESVRAIGGPSKGLIAVPSPAPGAVESPTVPAAKAVAVAAVEASPASGPSPKPPRRSQIEKASPKRAGPIALTQPEHPAIVTSAALPDVPALRPLPLERTNEILKSIVPPNSLGPREDADSSFRVSVRPVSGSRFERLARNIPLIGKRYRRPGYVPPVPVRNPAPPNLPHRNVAHDVNIDVKVYVNRSGKVDYSEVLSKVPETDRDLAASAAFSARQWEFVPARDVDGTVPGEVILHYECGPAARADGNHARIHADTIR